MEKYTCIECNGNNLVKQENLLVCQHCRSKYKVDDDKKTITLISTEQIVNYVQSEVQNILFECPKCENPRTKVIGKKSYFRALGYFISGWLFVFITPFIIKIKGIIYLATFRFNKVKKMAGQELWKRYVVWAKCWLILLTFGFQNLTNMYACEKCGAKWAV